MVSKTIVVCATVAFVVVIAAFTFLSFRHIDTTSLVTFALGLASGVAPNIASYVKTHNMAKTVEEVKEQTNGPLTRRLDALDSKLLEIQSTQDGESQ